MMADVAVLSWNMGTNGAAATSANSITGATGCDAEGFTIAITGNNTKNWSNGNGSIEYNAKTYTTLKNSNGAQNTVTLPEGCKATKVVFYVTTNNDASGTLTEFNGETCEDVVTSCKDYANPTVIEKDLTDATSFTFTFNVKQVCFIAVVTYTPAPADAPVTEVTITGKSTIVVGEKVTLTATTDVAATTIEWQDENEQTLGFGDTFDFTPDEEGTFTFYALAENAHNASPVKSTAFDVTVGPAPCIELYPAASGDDPVVGSVIDLATGSYGGKITVTGLKEAGSIKYNAAGLQFSGNSGDSVLVTLDNYLAVGTIIELTMRSGGKSGTRGLNILANNTKVFAATWEVADANDIRTIQYTVTSEDGLAGLYKFGLQRNNSVYLKNIKIYHCGAVVPELPTAVENAEAAVKAVKVVENGQLVIIKNGVRYNAQGAVVK